jgi:Flp pilus assembly protein TadG
MHHLAIQDRKRRGFILLTYAIMLFFTLAMIGLAVDAGTMYVIQGRLTAAVDAAALAAGRSVNLGTTLSAAEAAATATATQFFNANFPSGFLGTGTMNLTTPALTQQTDANGNPTGVLNIQVTATVPAPTYFMQIFGIKTVNVAATGTATRRSTVMIIVLDISSSMNAGSPTTACDTMKSAVQSFLGNFSPYDIIGVITFTYTAQVLYAPSSNFGGGTLNTDLGNITCTDNTNTTSGLWLAYEQIKSVGLPLAYNTIVLFTDGSPNGISANFPVRTQSDTRYGHDVGGTCPSLTATCTMPVLCTGSASQTVTGTMPQGSGQTDTGYTTGLFNPVNTDSRPSYPGTCSSTLVNTMASEYIRQLVAYIPDFDKYGNSTHGVPATSTPPTCPGSTCTVATVTLKSTGATYTYDTRDFWEYQVNNVCTGATGAAATACAKDSTAGQQYEGGVWSSFPSPSTPPSSGSNFFTSGPYKGYMRPDQPNTVVAATMNTAMAEAYWIRADASGCGTNGTACTTKYNTVINTIYLLGNAGDQADHEFLPIIANTEMIPALPYDSSWTAYTNPAFQTGQQQGMYQVSASASQLSVLFQNLASQVLRLSQ